MRPSFHPRLVNKPFDDPALFVPFIFDNRALLFDLGDINSLSSKDLLKISHVFISHTHVDHFVGFDQVLRIFLGRKKDLYFYGPEGFLKNIEGKLNSYCWNLVLDYLNQFVIYATEINSQYTITKQYICQNKFQSNNEEIKKPFCGILLEEPALRVYASILDHKTPCLSFAIQEQFHINIKNDSLSNLNLEPGPWLKDFKQKIFDKTDTKSFFEIEFGREKIKKKFILIDLIEQISLITPGQKIVYITDCIYNNDNINKMIELSRNADYLFIESAFLEKDIEIAQKKYHLTSRQAGEIAGRSKVKHFMLFHFSPRYFGQEDLLYKEAYEAYSTWL